MKKHNKNKKGLKIFASLMSVLIIISASFFIYFGIYYHATDDAKESLVSTNTVTVTEHSQFYDFTPAINLTSTGIIIYPGAKVEASSYAPLCMDIASLGVYVALVKMPFNFAFFGMDRAEKVMQLNSKISNYYIAGHSLGGVVGSSYAYKHADNLKGVIFLASYTTSDIKSTSLKVLSIYGSEDKVLKADQYEKAKSNLPEDYTEYVIEGGCHSYFADYGMQKGDGTPSISREEQMNQTTLAIKLFTYIS